MIGIEPLLKDEITPFTFLALPAAHQMYTSSLSSTLLSQSWSISLGRAVQATEYYCACSLLSWVTTKLSIKEMASTSALCFWEKPSRIDVNLESWAFAEVSSFRRFFMRLTASLCESESSSVSPTSVTCVA